MTPPLAPLTTKQEQLLKDNQQIIGAVTRGMIDLMGKSANGQTGRLKNALDFLNACPKSCTLDILSHSRGGLIADILAKCDYNNPAPGFSEKEIGILKGKAEEENRALMVSINQVAAQKKIKINKVIRVAAPASGTTILSRRVDHFFNLLLNAASLAFGIANPLYHTVKAFLLELISQKDNPDVLPGLNAMMPESLFQKMMNISDDSVASDLYNISGDSDVGGINFSSLKVILANFFNPACLSIHIFKACLTFLF